MDSYVVELPTILGVLSDSGKITIDSIYLFMIHDIITMVQKIYTACYTHFGDYTEYDNAS